MNFNKIATGLAAIAAATAFTTGVSTDVAYAQDSSFVNEGDNTFTVNAKEIIVEDGSLEKAVSEAGSRAPGWYPLFHIGGSAQVTYNHHVDGGNEGTAFVFGLEVKAGMDGIFDVGAGKLEWDNALTLEHQQTKMPQLDHFVKSKDVLDFSTMLLYRSNSLDWIGPYLRFNLHTSILPGYYTNDQDTYIREWKANSSAKDKKNFDRDADAKGISRVSSAEINEYARANGKKLELEGLNYVDAQDQKRLSKAFSPLVLTESIGAFIDPYTSEPFTIQFRVGAAGKHQILNDTTFSSWDQKNNDTFWMDDEGNICKANEEGCSEYDVYDVKRLEDVNSVGIEGIVNMKGVLVDWINWTVFGSIYYPFAGDWDKDIYDGADVLHAEVGGKISFRFSDWGSLDWTIDAKREPFVTLDWQFNTNLLLSIGFDLFK